jgi:hypothetical protein
MPRKNQARGGGTSGRSLLVVAHVSAAKSRLAAQLNDEWPPLEEQNRTKAEQGLGQHWDGCDFSFAHPPGLTGASATLLHAPDSVQQLCF